MAEQITMQIPAAAFDAMTTQAPSLAYESLIRDGATPLINILTFGFINTPIINASTGIIVAYVTLWEYESVTVCRVDGDSATLIGHCSADSAFDTLEAMRIFNMFWGEE